MESLFKFDRHFLFLHAENLAVFTERILRNTSRYYLNQLPKTTWENTNEACLELRKTLVDPNLKRKVRTDAIREKEAVLLFSLEKLAVEVENIIKYKSDALATGFHLHADQNKGVTRRQMRMSAKMARISTIS